MAVDPEALVARRNRRQGGSRMRALWRILARAGTPVAVFVGRSFQAVWYAIEYAVRPVLAPLEAALEPITGRWVRRGVMQDLDLANRLDAAGLSTSATLLRNSAVERLTGKREAS